ncbi:hypothetical protein BDP27DRAFT_1323084 [Rhodocollybia butyracea]|uniref:Uncharacterized protein n=1 Tax=Rhodocollybia butyracea TaxID=206335 RepID=A0A9P5U9D4_9AGAR|nr:hypothetical protein BDP27DRAFT_1323084 [Rhodocollybia butyracea]
MALYPYTTDEFSLLAASTQLSSATTTKLLPIAGSMFHSNPVKRISGQQPRTIISDVYLYSIRHKFFLPLNWFTKDRLQLAQHRLHDLHTKVHRTEPTAESTPSEVKVLVFDMLKMSALWGDDMEHTCMLPMKWLECMLNYLSALVTLSPAHSPGFNNFETSYPIWYMFECTAWNEILQGTLFSKDHYVQNLGILLQVRDQVKLLTASFLQSSSTPAKCPSDSDLHGAIAAKATRTVTNDSPQSFRNTDSPKRTSSPTCIICAASHLLRLHCTSAVAFSNGKPCFSAYQDSELRTLKPLGSAKETKPICIPYNLASSCKHQHDDG